MCRLQYQSHCVGLLLAYAFLQLASLLRRVAPPLVRIISGRLRDWRIEIWKTSFIAVNFYLIPRHTIINHIIMIT